MDDLKRSRALLDDSHEYKGDIEQDLHAAENTNKKSHHVPIDVHEVNASGIVSELVKDSNDCITFLLVKDAQGVMPDDGDDDNIEHFGPLMSHQLYGDEETIEGYKSPWIKVYLSPLFLPCVVVGYDAKVLEERATDLMKPMREAFSSCSLQNSLDDFVKVMKEEGGVSDSLGELILTKDLGGQETLEIWRSNLSTASEFVKKVHSRIEPLLLFFIDAASAIDAEDPGWEILLGTVKDCATGNVRIVAMSTVYSFYVYPDKKRFRLSQAFVLPPEQGKGIGSAIVDAVFNLARKAGVVDVTLEDPTDDFRRLRDRKDLKDMLAVEWITKEALEKLHELGNGGKGPQKAGTDKLSLSPGQGTIQKLCEIFMMNKKQAERMWEVLLYKIATDTTESDKTAAVEGYISKTLEDSFVAGAKDGSENKVVEDTPTGFIMYKSTSKAQIGPGNIPPVEDVTSEQQRSMIADYVATRVEEIRTLVSKT